MPAARCMTRGSTATLCAAFAFALGSAGTPAVALGANPPPPTLQVQASPSSISVDANVHTREWITNTIATYLIDTLFNDPVTTSASTSASVADASSWTSVRR